MKTQQQKKDLLKLYRLIANQFYLNMKDRWTQDDYQTNKEYDKAIDKAETDYINTYNEKPQAKNIDEIFEQIKILRKELA